MNRFGAGSKVYAALSMAAELVLINILILLTSLPLITGGMALTAGFAACLAIIGGTGSPVRQFLTTLRTAWLPATLAWLALLVLATLLAWEMSVVGQMRSALLSTIAYAVLGLAALLVMLTTLWFWPLLARRSLTGEQVGVREGLELARTALLASVKYLPRSLVAAVIVGAPLAVGLLSPEVGARLLLWNAAIGVALTCYLILLAFRAPLGVSMGDDKQD